MTAAVTAPAIHLDERDAESGDRTVAEAHLASEQRRHELTHGMGPPGMLDDRDLFTIGTDGEHRQLPSRGRRRVAAEEPAAADASVAVTRLARHCVLVPLCAPLHLEGDSSCSFRSQDVGTPAIAGDFGRGVPPGLDASVDDLGLRPQMLVRLAAASAPGRATVDEVLRPELARAEKRTRLAAGQRDGRSLLTDALAQSRPLVISHQRCDDVGAID